MNGDNLTSAGDSTRGQQQAATPAAATVISLDDATRQALITLLAERDEQTLRTVVAALILAGETTAAQLVSDLRDRLLLAEVAA